MNNRHTIIGVPLKPVRRRVRRALLLVGSVATLVAAASLTVLGSGNIATSASSWGALTEPEAVEAVAVHGQWSIRVSDPDGTPVAAVEFSNDLTESGAASLSALLAGDAVAGVWNVQLAGSRAAPTCGGDSCDIHTADASRPNSTASLSVLVPDSGELRGALVLDGSITADGRGVVDRVRTQQYICESSVTVSACQTDSSLTSATTVSEADFTATGVAPITVEPGQVIEVTVIISFS